MVQKGAREHKSERKEHAKYNTAFGPGTGKFTKAEDVRAALGSHDTGALTLALTILRNQLTVQPNENALSPQDERLLLAKAWLEKYPGGRDIFSIIDRTPAPSPTILSLSLGVISSLLHILSAHLIYHTLGDPIVKNLLSPSRMRQLTSNLSGASSELTLSTLKVLNVMSTFAGGVNQRFVMDGFPWGQKSLSKLLFLRRKGKGAHQADPVARPDIRTLYIFFILSFLSNATPTPIKLSLLEQHRDVFLLIFKGIPQDPYLVARCILKTCWEGAWNDPKIKRTLKIALFSESTLNHILKLYVRNSPEDDIPDHIPADLVHHFLLALTTHPGVGICFKDRGWYPRDNTLEQGTMKAAEFDDGDETLKVPSGKIYNKILANIVKGLKVNEDARQQELALKILEACPELVAGYWGSANLTLEPRLSSRWITNISIFGSIVSLPTPSSSFLLPHSTHHNPSPPPLSSTLANVLPSVLPRSHLTKGLQSSSSLVQHCTALTFSKCLFKLHNVLSSFREVAQTLEEVSDIGQWSNRCRELESEVEKRVPDFMVVVAMVQQKHLTILEEQDKQKAVLLSESALRLLWLYHKLFPRLIAEVKFDVGKLLLSVVHPVFDTPPKNDEMDIDQPLIFENQSGMDVVRQLHVLRLLKESDQFTWSSKSGLSSHSYLHAILTLYVKTPHAAVRGAASELLSHVFSPSILFSHDPPEVTLWLGALPLTRRAPHAAAPDGTPLSDEGTGVLGFLDDCIQRCIKTPYRYLEDCQALFADVTREDSQPDDTSLTQDTSTMAPSPLLMTVLEQVRAKTSANLLSPSDTLAIVTFIRKLVCSMICKQPDLRHAWKVSSRLEEILSAQNLSLNSPMLRDAIRRECTLLSQALAFIEEPILHTPLPHSPVVQEFLRQAENQPIPSSNASAANSAYELVDWMRLVQPQLHPNDVNRLLSIILRFWPSAAKEFFYQVDPRQGQIWCFLDVHQKELEKHLPFDLAYLHSVPSQVAQTLVKDCLVALFFSETSWCCSPERMLSIVMHRLGAGRKGDARSRHAELSLLTSIMHRGRVQKAKPDLDPLKRAIFVEARPIRDFCCSRVISDAELSELSALVRVSLDSHVASDKALVLEYCDYWVAQSKNAMDLRLCVLASPWVTFMEPASLIQHLDIVIRAVEGGQKLTDLDQKAVDVILAVLTHPRTTTQLLAELQQRSRGLLIIRPLLHQYTKLDSLLLFMVQAGLPIGLDTLPLSVTESVTASDMALSAYERWCRRSTRLPLDSAFISAFLRSKHWDETAARVLSGAMYKSSAARRSFWAWLTESEPPRGLSFSIITIALHAYLDIKLIHSDDSATRLPDPWFLALTQCLLQARDPEEARILYASCIRSVLETSPSLRRHYVKCFLEEVRSTPFDMTNSPFLVLVRDLYQLDASVFSALLVEVGDNALEWMVQRFSNPSTEFGEALSNLEELVGMISRIETKAHLVEPVVKAAIQNCLHVSAIIQCVNFLVGSTRMKPAIVNRYLQSIVQHSHLYRLTNSAHSTREPIIKLLHTLFHIHPANTCQPSHIVPIARLYGGTLSLSDRLMSSIFYLYENQRGESMASVFRHWSPSPSALPSQDALAAIMNLDPSRVFRVCRRFPTRRHLDVAIIGDISTREDDMYDPVFLTLLVAQFLLEHKDISATDWVQMFRSNIISLLMCVMTSRDEPFRGVGLTTLAGVLRRVQAADFLEKNQVLYILDMLRNLLPPPSSTNSPARLPTYPVMLLAHALRSTFYPFSFLYPVVSRFLLQRPELDITDVPMLYSLLFSSEDGEWAKERAWMMRFLADAMHEGGACDWEVLKRRHTWDLVASMWQAARVDERSLRKGILEFLGNLSTNPHAVNSLIRRSSLLSWIEMQLQTGIVHDTENEAWVKVLENIIVMADGDKTEKATGGEFRSAVARCLDLILCNSQVTDETDPEAQIGLLHLISRVLLRVAMQHHPPTAILADVLSHAIKVLKSFEPSIPWTSGRKPWKFSKPVSLPEPPHHASGLFDLLGAKSEVKGEVDSTVMLTSWSGCVTNFWQVLMWLTEWQGDSDCWDAVTCRLLMVRTSASCGLQAGDGVHLGEWARRETVGRLLGADLENELYKFI